MVLLCHLMRRFVFQFLFALVIVLISPATVVADSVKAPNGGFEITGFVNTAYGFQHYSDDPITEFAIDGSTGGPIGEWVNVGPIGGPQLQDSTISQFFVPDVEVDIIKSFGNRARLRADLRFGRPNSGSQIAGIGVTHAYAGVILSHKHGIELLIGRFGMPPGFEPYDNYDNDTVSWSILWRGLLTPGSITGVRLTYSPSEHTELFFAAGNGFINDDTTKGNQLPSFLASALFKWGPLARQSTLVLSPFAGPESGGNRPVTIGGDATLSWWINNTWQLGLEAVGLRGGNSNGPSTSYLGTLFNLHYEPAPSIYGVFKYSFAWQTGPGTANLNLTGAEQRIHEISVGMGHYLGDGLKLKTELRLDLIDPTYSAMQWVGGAAMELCYAF